MILHVLRALAFAAVFLTSFRLYASAPTAATNAATTITSSSVVLNGSGLPNGELTTGWFRLSTTHPGTCDDTFGTRVPAAGGTDLGAGVASVNYSINATGLLSGTYYFCAIVSNPSGAAFGTILSFTIPAAPAVVTGGVTALTSTGATLMGSGNPNFAATTGWFRYSTTNPGVCDDVFGTRAPASSGSNLGSGSSLVDYTRAVTGLTPGATYYYCAIASNPWGTSFGSVQSFTALPNPPAVTTNGATLVTGTTAQLNGSANPGGAATTGWFRYSTVNPGTCNDTFGSRAPLTGGQSLGAGNTAVAYSLGITGLTTSTTYYFCAISQNSAGTGFGGVLSFTTPSAPSVITVSSSLVTNNSATLNGSGNPNGAATTGYFRYGLTNPGTCDDTFGSRAPVTGGSALGNGNSVTNFSQSISGLSANTTYYFCAIATNSEGIAFGLVQSFITPSAPTAATSAATVITATGATLNGSGNPTNNSAFGYFRYSTVNPGACDDSFGTRAPPLSGNDSVLGTGSSDVTFNRPITGLTPSTTYYFCAITRNTYGTAFGAVLSFTTIAAPPTVVTNGVTLVTGATAQLNGSANPGGAPTTAWFRYATASPGTCNDTFGIRAPAAGGSSLGGGNASVGFNQAIVGLSQATTYYVCAIAQNSAGLAVGAVQSFTTPSAPTVTTTAVGTVTDTSAVLNGTGTPNGATTTGYFRYSTTNPGTCDDVFGSRAPTTGGSSLGSSGSSGFAQTASGLSAGTTYYYCAIATSSEGIAFGTILSFTTPAPPTASTSAATVITSTGATLNGASDPNLSSGFGYFRYATVNPGACNDTFGTRAPPLSGNDTSLGSGTSDVTFSRPITGLTPATTYYFCAIGRNGYGTAFGAVLTFTTLANPPTVITNGATLLTGTTAQLNGTTNPGGDPTTGWFRYSTASPGSCNDTFGTRAPATGGSAVGMGTSSVSFAQGITGLAPGTTYYFCAIAQNAAGTAFGGVQSFMTPSPPTVTTGATTLLTNVSVTLNGSANPNGSTSTGWFRYSLTNPGACDDVFGSRAPATGGSNLGNGTSATNFAQSVTNLSAGTTYYYCAIASSAEGVAFGAVQSFITPTAPTAASAPATVVTATTATLNGSGNPNNNSAFGYFRYATINPGACDDVFGTRAPPLSGSDTSIGSGSTDANFNRAITGLTPGTTYYFCAITRNTFGNGFGAVLSFTTLPATPVVTTSSASLLTGTTAQLNGTANPGGAVTTGWFRYATASPGSCNDTFGTRAPGTGGAAVGSGNSAVAFNQGISGLTPATTYYYCAIAQNSAGTGFGAVQSFLTPSPPTVTTTAANTITNNSAIITGTATPNGSTTTAYFRYSPTNPGTCDDTFGSRAPATGGTSISAGSGSTNFAQTISGLTAGATYYFCAIASSAEGIAFGSVLSFITPNAPTATTSPATLVASTTATLNGLGDPNLNSAFGYFRYGTTNPGTCDDAFGTRAPPLSGSDTSLGNGSTDVSHNRPITGLSPGVTYYFCAITRNSYGTAFGAVLSFTTQPTLPSMTTNAATLLTGTTAQLNGVGNPGGAAATAWFRYATVSPGSCNDTFGTKAPAAGTAIGSGNSGQSFSQGITGLSPNTQYWFCAIGQNSVGTAFGAVVTFTTPSPPTVTTTPPTVITNVSATLNGTATANGSTTTGYFRYSLTNPGACDDTFGSRAPTTGGTTLASSAVGAGFSQSVSGLSAGTTYYYCAIASSAEGIAFGVITSFTTPTQPVTTSAAATLVTSSSATLNGSANPNLNSAFGYFRYATTNPIVCNDTFGTRAPPLSGSDSVLGNGGTDVAFNRPITGLTPGTTYYFCAIGRNTYGTTFGAVLSFTTPATAPSALTNGASGVTTSGATLNGTGNPSGADSTGWFRYSTASPGTCNDTFGTRAPTTGGSALGSGISATNFAQAITGLTPGTTYYFCAIVQNSVGIAFGGVVSFTTTAPPAVATLAATPVTATTATLNGTVNPNGFATTGYFRYSSTNPGACDTTFGTATANTSLGSGTTVTPMSAPLTGLAPATTYYFCAIGTSSIGTSLGALLSFTTPAAPPSVLTVAASAIDDDMATLNGTINPNGSATTGWFRYSTTNPGTCNDTFGTRIPATGGTSFPLGNQPVDFALPISGLTTGTTYYFCALGQSGIGTGVGAVLSFTTASLPTVTTSAATAVAATGATLNGTANPNVSATTGYFRYDTTNPGTCNDTFGTRAPATGGSSLGAGSAAVPFSQALTGLTPGSTYYFCAIAQNAVGTSFGNVLTFNTAAAPTVTTNAASAVTGTTATLSGAATPNLLTATGWFRYSTVDPGTCNDTFGTRAPVSSGTALGAGSAAVPYSQGITGLANGTTYYFCAIASNASGTGFGAVMSFTTAAPPMVVTLAPTSVTNNTATLNGTANPNGLAGTGWFRYSTTNPVTCNDTFGTRAPSSSGSALGAGSTAVPYSQGITGLAAGTTYYVCAIASNSLGTRFGTPLSFSTTAPPTVTTTAANALSSTGATLNGTANPNSLAANGWFRYSTTSPGTCNDTFGTRAPASGGTALGNGNTAVTYAQAITGLNPGTQYFFCAIADNSAGTSFGTVLSFTTLAAPTVVTSAASSVTSSGATLNGSGNPRGSATTGWYRYDTVNPGTCDDTFGTRAPATGGSSLGTGTSAVTYTQGITGLAAATTYYFCAIAQNAVGTSFGSVLTFTTASAPTVTTNAPSAIASTTATLNGAANPNLLSATGYFRYSATNPGTCSDTFGTRAPTSGGTALGAGSTAVTYTQGITGLTAGTTYYFCAIASNSAGLGFGAVQSFTTAGAPTVTTVAATSVTNTGATLNGTASPNQLTATGWFRYSTTNPVTCNDTFGTRTPTSGGTALGSGSAAVPYAQTVSALAPATTYYFCAIASNSSGTRFGTVMSFTTTAAPTVATLAVSGLSSTDATLNATANPRLSDTSGWFRYGTVNPGACNDTFGTRVPTVGSEVALGNGSTAVPYSQALTGLVPGATYYYCAIAQNAVGTSFGAVMTFTTTDGPTVTTAAATLVTTTGATLNGTGDPNLSATTGWFRYSNVNPGTCDDTFGTRAPVSNGTSLGTGTTAVAYSQAITGLSPATTYYYCAIAQNAVGTSFGAVMSFTTTAPPLVVTAAATSVTSTAATLNGSGTPNQLATTGWFRYSVTNPGTCNDTFGTRAPTAGGSALGNGSSPVSFSQSLAGLTAGATYYYCAIASNSAGVAFGTVMSFTTTAAPVVLTVAATGVTSTDAVLNGSANPSLDATTAWFRYSTTSPGACNDTFGTRTPTAGGSSLGAGSTPVAFTQPLTGLSPATTYYFCAIASNSIGTRFGAVLSFSTTGAPTATTQAATSVTSTDAVLNGSGNPNQVDATGWFRYDTTNPGTCNDTFGTRAPTTGGTSLGNGTATTAFTQSLTGLAPGTTYYFCAIAGNAIGTGFGAVMSFTTASAPSVTTDAPTLVLSTAASLNGSANPNLAATTGWFRYDTVDPGTCDDAFGTRVPMTGGTALGAGSAVAPFTQALAGLTPLTTYYYCAIASNAIGTSFGAVLSFTTTGAPAVVTKDATLVKSSSATLNGSVNPNLAAATGWFRYAETDPGNCNDTFGTRAPTTGGTNIPAGASPVDYLEPITGLTPGKTYYFCAIANNQAGKAFGEVLTLETLPDLPVVTTLSPMDVQAVSADLRGSAKPGGGATTGWFRYSQTDPGNCDDTFGTRVPATGGTSLGSGLTAVTYTESITGLMPETTYYYCAIAENSEGTGFGKILTLKPTAIPPTVVTVASTGVTGDSATISGTANPNEGETTGYFRYGDVEPETCDDTYGTRMPETGGTMLGSGTDPAPFSEVLKDLLPKTTYYYCAAASNWGGPAFGEVMSFTTAAVPPVMTTSPAVVGDAGITLKGFANPNASETKAWFRFDKTDPGECNDTFGTKAPTGEGQALGAGRKDVDYSETVTGLAPGKYYACAVGSNEAGLGFGEVVTFDVPEDKEPPPTKEESGCSVGVGPSSNGGSVAALLALVLLAARRRRRQA